MPHIRLRLCKKWSILHCCTTSGEGFFGCYSTLIKTANTGGGDYPSSCVLINGACALISVPCPGCEITWSVPPTISTLSFMPIKPKQPCRANWPKRRGTTKPQPSSLIESITSSGERVSLTNIGFIHDRLGQYEEALGYYEQAVSVAEAMRGEMRVEEFKSSFVAEQVYVYDGIVSLLVKMDRPQDAFGYAQRAKARTLLDQLGNVRVRPIAVDDPVRGGPPELVQVCESLDNRDTRARELGALAEAMAEVGTDSSAVVTLIQEERVETDSGTIQVIPAREWFFHPRWRPD